MAKVTIRLYTTLKEIAQSDKVELDAKDLDEALRFLSNRFGKKFSDALYDAEKSSNGSQVVRNCFNLVVNSEMAGLKNLDKKELKDGDRIHIFPPIAGG